MRPLKILLAMALAAAAPLVTQTSAAPHAAAATPTPTPQTVPALRQWTAGTGSFTFGATSRVVVDPAYASQITGDANTFAADLSALEGRKVSVAQGRPSAGDIELTLGYSSTSREAYKLTAGSSIVVRGATSTGEFWGTRTVLQLLHQSPTIQAGTAVDSPTKPERGLMIDTGRRFFPVGWVENHIRELSYLKMNYFHLHLSDTYGFRLESSTHPEITSAQHYSKQDIAHIIELGRRYHVMIVPEIDMPGHMDAILKGELKIGHDYRLKNSSGNASDGYIDLTIPGARTLLSDLIREYEPLFTSSPYWHVGADEYTDDYDAYPQLLTYAHKNYGPKATAKDTYYGFVNWADGIVRSGHKTMRMWNDGIKGDGTISPNSDIIVEYWYGLGLNPQQLVDAGHTVANQSWDPTYYVYGKGKPDTTGMYESWKPDVFEDFKTISDPSKNLGSVIHVWCDDPFAETVDQTAAGIKYPLRDLAQMTWGSPKLVSTYAAFVPIMDAVGRNPLWPTTAPNLNGHTITIPTTSDSGQALDDPASSTTAGTQLITWHLHGHPNQQWAFVEQSDGSYQFVNQKSKLCAEVNGGSIVQRTCSYDSSQHWKITPLAGGVYTIASIKSGLLLTTASKIDHAEVTQETDAKSDLQHWAID